MKSLFAAAFLLLLSGAAQAADGICENFARYGAIRAYKAEAGEAATDGLKHYASPMKANAPDRAVYLVKIVDRPAGEKVEASYFVTIDTSDAGCKVAEVLKSSAL